MHISLDHAHIFASNISVTLDFLQRIFGAVVVWDEDAAGVRNIRMRIGRGFIHMYDQGPKAQRGGPIHHLGIETDNLEELVAHMKRSGVEIRNEVRQETKFSYVMIAGPDDLLIELFQCNEPERWQLQR